MVGDRPSGGNASSGQSIRRGVDALAALAILFHVAGLSEAQLIAVPAVGLLAPLLAALAFALLIATGLAVAPLTLQRIEVGLLGVSVLLIALDVIAVLHLTPPYRTDEAALLQAAGTLVLHGREPYGVDLISSLRTFHVPTVRQTPLLSGGVVSTVEYPGLAVLLAAAAVWFTHGYQSMVVADTTALICATVLTFLLLPTALRGLAVVVVLALPGLVSYALGGSSAALALPFLVLAVWRWNAPVSESAASRDRMIRAVSLGLACGISQLAWLVGPFLLVIIWRKEQLRHGWGGAIRLAGPGLLITGATFGLVNLPFALLGGHAWLSAIVAPILQPAIPLGLGVAVLPLLAHVGGGDLGGYGSAAALLYVGLLIVAWHWPSRVASVALVFPVVPVLLSTRALAEYWALLVPVWLLAAASVKLQVSSPAQRAPSTVSVRTIVTAAIAGGVVLAAFGQLALAITSPPPIAVSIAGYSVSKGHTTSRITVELTNRLARQLRPHFVISTQLGQTVWHAVSGPLTLRGHATITYHLAAPAGGALSADSLVQVDVLTTAPDALSASAVHQIR